MYELKISPKFTIDDIHKIRKYNYEITKHMNIKELSAYYEKSADKVETEIQKIREEKALRRTK
jgi:hypothetical protein